MNGRTLEQIMESATIYTAFSGLRQLARGSLSEVTTVVRTALAGGAEGLVILEDESGRTVDFDPRMDPSGSIGAVAQPTQAPAKPGRGRPRLGVTAREVTLLPRHWDWLGTQPGGASAALRRLVDQARRDNLAGDRNRKAREAAHRAMTTLAGDLPGYEDALRALYSGDRPGFSQLLAKWPKDVRLYVQELADRRGEEEDPPH
jgi:hypothetical protein